MKAKPFIKWVGGKGQLIEQLDANLPADFGKWNDVTYIEPFVGGGAVFMGIQASKYYINDFSLELIDLYNNISTSNKKFFKYIIFKLRVMCFVIFKEIENSRFFILFFDT